MNTRITVALVIFITLSVTAMTWGGGLNSVLSFVDMPSIMIVIGVTSAGAIWSFPFSILKQSFADAFSEVELDADRAGQGHQVFIKLSNFAVASGLYGTLIGLVKMLSNLDDPTTIGPAMAVALLTLFYGVTLGEFFCKSMANSFLIRSQERLTTSPRGYTTVYFAVFGLFVMMLTFCVMLLAGG
jgi:flagellar motor component MotA